MWAQSGVQRATHVVKGERVKKISEIFVLRKFESKTLPVLKCLVSPSRRVKSALCEA